MRVVIDTNVFVSGVFFSGLPNQVLQRWHNGEFQMILSLEILEEVKRVGEILAKEHPPVNLKPMFDLVFKEASHFTASPLPASVCEDPEGDKFLVGVLASRSKIVVSGDKHFLKISGYQNIED